MRESSYRIPRVILITILIPLLLPVNILWGAADPIDVSAPCSFVTDIVLTPLNTLDKAYLPVTYSDNDFVAPSSVYNDNLGTILAALSAAANNQEDIEKSLVNLGFSPEKIALYNYEPCEKTDNKVGFSFAHKEIAAAGTVYNLISINIRGTVGNEWYSNFNISLDTDDHAGFKSAEEELLTTFGAYLSEHGLTACAENKIVITGHSRGAAVANLLAADLTKNQQFAAKDNIYAYTFATPNVSKSTDVKNTAAFNNIFNFVNAEDFIPYLPLAAADWGYGKYGMTLMFPSRGMSADYDTDYMNRMNERMQALIGLDYNHALSDPPGNEPAPFSTYNGCGTVQDVIKKLLRLAPSVEDFYQTNHPALPVDSLLTTQAYFELMCDVQSGSASAQSSASKMSALLTNADFGRISQFLLTQSGNSGAAHAPVTYIAWMQATAYEDLLQHYTGQYARITCPAAAADIEVYTCQGELAGRVSNNTVDESIKSSVEIFVDGNIKSIYMPVQDTYKIRLVGTGAGTMSYTVEDIDIVTAAIRAQKEFTNVQLDAGKEILSKVTDISDVKLQIIENGVVVGEITQDGTEIIQKTPEIKTTVDSKGNGQVNINFDIRSANGKGYQVWLSEKYFGAYTLASANFNSKGAHVKGLISGKTYYAYVVYSDGKNYEKSHILTLKP